jgi:hypothetical protein
MITIQSFDFQANNSFLSDGLSNIKIRCNRIETVIYTVIK